MVSNDGKHSEQRISAICHMGMTYGGWSVPVPEGVFDQLITSYNAVDVHWFTFFDFLVTYPFKQWANIIHLEQTSEGQYYIRVSDLSAIPNDVLYNFCIFTRVPWEFPRETKVWEGHVKTGMHPCFAFAVCRANPKDSVIAVFLAGNSNHWPIDMMVNLERFVQCTPVSRNIPYKTSNHCIPCNVMWGSTSLHLKSLQGQTVNDFWLKWKAEHEDILQSSG